MLENAITELGKGKIRFEYGPVSMVLCAWKHEEPMDELFLRDACGYVADILAELSEQLSQLKRPWKETKLSDFRGISVLMRESAERTGDDDFTPMATVAGATSELTADFLSGLGATKIIVNNGGDIALRMAKDDVIRVGIVSSLETGQISRAVEIKGSDGILGVCTSGLGGRSFTLGIADTVTVFAKSCPVADAFATYLANKTFIESPSVKQVKAGAIDPGSDIAGLLVTTEVGRLTIAEVEESSAKFREEAKKAIALGHIKSAYCYIKGTETVCDGGS